MPVLMGLVLHTCFNRLHLELAVQSGIASVMLQPPAVASMHLQPQHR